MDYLLLYYFLAMASMASSTPITRQTTTVPQFVLDFAPLVHLDQQEEFFPSDITAQLTNSHPTDKDNKPIPNAASPLTLSNLENLPNTTFVTSNEGITSIPPWFRGVRPDPNTHRTPGAMSSVIILAPKPTLSVLDVFYFYFYAYNAGTSPLSLPNFSFGNHVGDWEHVMIRFNTTSTPTQPTAAWYSAHSLGQAFLFSALSLQPATSRPLVYAARGTHANYASPGPHESAFPGQSFPGILLPDQTSAGPLWDPTIDAYYFSYDSETEAYTALTNPVTGAAGVSTGFLEFEGRWGDPQLPDEDERQVNLFGQRKYTDGPTGPRDKRLGRREVCNVDDGGECRVRTTLFGTK
jgi:hypothetical protein